MKTLLAAIVAAGFLTTPSPAAECPPNSSTFIDREQFLASSQISYRAEGGFTGVRSYSVIINCVKGEVSILKSIYDPRLDASAARVRQVGTMSADRYLALAQGLMRLNMPHKSNAPKPTEDTLDEFTYHFSLSVGDRVHEFEAAAISRPLASCYFAMRNLIDHAVDMGSLWNAHSALAFRITADNQSF